MRRILGVLLFCSSLLLVAAAPPTPGPLITPTSSPPPVVTPPPANEVPTVVVFPFDVPTGQDAKIGTAIATIMHDTMNAAGGVNVLAIPKDVTRPQFGTYARAQHADFYVAGFVTPVGEGAAIVDQVVSVSSGVIVYSNTLQVVSVDDVAAQALQQRAAIFALIGRGRETLTTQSASTPAPTSTNGASVPLKGIAAIVDSVFGSHHGKPGATPMPAVSAKPARGMFLVPATGASGVAAKDLATANTELVTGLGHFYTVKPVAAATDVAKAADSICGTNRDNTVASGTLTETSQHHRTQYNFSFQVFTCFGALLAGTTGTGPNLKKAVDDAIAAYATAHADNS
ncbi:MAG: hypothetical protein JO199_05110 [Candidatus Eremiobacteraeota bacterium]|nr:hypothetical protein [Candidatus Eremiobacteraeota bacterium]